MEAQVSAQGREAVTGNVFIWFLCAVAFLKVSQKIDSFMASLGVNVGHTGGSMLAEAMIAARGVTMMAGAAGHVFSGFGRKGGSTGTPGASDPSGSTGTSGFLKGGLAGMVGRKITSDAVKTATSATHSASSATAAHASHTATAAHTAGVVQSASATHTGHSATAAKHTSTAQRASSATAARTSSHMVSQHRSSLGGAIFANSLLSGGRFANDVIGKVARGDIRSTGSITGDMATQSLLSYMGFTAMEKGAADIPSYSRVEIGGGRISGTEVTAEHPEGIAFGMYHADQYAAPEGDFSKVHSADGALWYKQYAVDSVERKPFKAPDGGIAYHESIVKKLPNAPKRKDRI